MISEIQARTLLASVKQPDPYFGLKYNFNLYRGCQHHCIYCDSRSECYQIAAFDRDVLVKSNALELLEKELSHKRIVGTIGTGSMNDPYMPLEAERNLTGRALEIIARYRFPVHIITKSDLVLRDAATLQKISRVYAAVSITITTADDHLSQQLEPGAPVSSRRFAALSALSAAGIYCGITLMPVLPYLTDSAENLRQMINLAQQAGAKYILGWYSVTLRDRQRAYFYARLDQSFPGLRAKYEALFGDRYSCVPPGAQQWYELLQTLCTRAGIATKMQVYTPTPTGQQLSLF